MEPKITRMVRANTVVTLQIAGDGGFGDPAERDPQAIRDDLADGSITAGAALCDYRFQG